MMYTHDPSEMLDLFSLGAVMLHGPTAMVRYFWAARETAHGGHVVVQVTTTKN